jgi:uncharacterized protein YggU (UPF0235/DUF167 family)
VSCWRADGGALLLSVRLTPRSAREGVGGLWTDEAGALWLKAQVRAVPEKGRANDALMQLMARVLDVPPRAISLAAGDTNRLKRLRIMGEPEALAQAIDLLAGQQ